MDKPKDYSKYFNDDGSKKKCPYEFGSKLYYEWIIQQQGLLHLLVKNDSELVSDDVKKHYREAMRNLAKKMQSSVGGAVPVQS
ncbi:MAG: hypothetical protein LBC84_09180 [Prevotellaceae bacterium]|jgi:hypothetical protein|nr:hypothetical protein [Prevotellaceae bacterium]